MSVGGRCLEKTEEAWEASCGSNAGPPSRKGRSRSWREKQRFQFFLKGNWVSVWQVGWSPGSTEDPGGAREILELYPEHSWADHSVPGVLWGKVCALLSLLLPAAAEKKGPWGSQLAGAHSRLQFVGQGGEDLLELLIAPGLAAAGSLTAPQ